MKSKRTSSSEGVYAALAFEDGKRLEIGLRKSTPLWVDVSLKTKFASLLKNAFSKMADNSKLTFVGSAPLWVDFSTKNSIRVPFKKCVFEDDRRLEIDLRRGAPFGLIFQQKLGGTLTRGLG